VFGGVGAAEAVDWLVPSILAWSFFYGDVFVSLQPARGYVMLFSCFQLIYAT
jgi:hypothetical protein